MDVRGVLNLSRPPARSAEEDAHGDALSGLPDNHTVLGHRPPTPGSEHVCLRRILTDLFTAFAIGSLRALRHAWSPTVLYFDGRLYLSPSNQFW